MKSRHGEVGIEIRGHLIVGRRRVQVARSLATEGQKVVRARCAPGVSPSELGAHRFRRLNLAAVHEKDGPQELDIRIPGLLWRALE